MVEIILEPLKYNFFIRGLLAGLIVSIACGVLSGFIVWRGMAFIGDALAHAILPGIVIAVILGANLLIGALISALVAVFGIGVFTRRKGFKEDTAIGVIFAGLFALGVLLISKVGTFKDLSHILFGNILGVMEFDLLIIGIVGLVVVILIYFFYKELLVTSFDTTHAIAIGLSPLFIHFLLLVLIAVTTVIATQTVGVILVLALLVTPAATASLLVRELNKIIWLSVLFSLLAIVMGFYISYHLDLSSGATIVLFLTGLFLIAYLKNLLGNLVSKNK